MSNPDPHPESSRASDCPDRPGCPVIQRIPARVSRLGPGFEVRRALPSKQRRMIGAWCFFDHAGPVEYAAGGGMAVGPHPHMGLQTFTWMIAGRIRHSDSLGNNQWIEPGQVNLMSAGHGISHAEESDPDRPGWLHLAQLWIALPDAVRNEPPAFIHYPELPEISQDALAITVLVGEHAGRTSPVEVHTPLLAVDLMAESAGEADLALDPAFEHGLMVLEGNATMDGERFTPGELAYLGEGRDRLTLSADADSRMLLIGGEPFAEDILLWWNFVARSHEEIEQAAAAWKSGQRFGQVPDAQTPPLKIPGLEGVRLKTHGQR